jgi:hypothetical protein
MLLLLCLGCGSDDKSDPDVGEAKAELRCVANVIERDLDMSPMGGSSVDEETGTYKLREGEQVIVSSTYGIPVPGSDGKPLPASYQDLMGRIIGQLQQQPGLLALQLGTSDSCGSGRTLAVWESEEAMYAFVTSPPHMEAMTNVHKLVQPGYAVTHWSASSPEQLTVAEAAKHLEEALQR